MPELWIPGFEGPHEDFVARVHRQIERFARERGIDQAVVEVELRDGARYTVGAISPDPGYGFITITPHEEEDAPAELVVPVGSLARIELYPAEEQRARFGFSLPSS